MNDERAPTCPISYDQEPANPRGTAPIRLPSIPIATDLPSLIRAVNIMRDILRTLTTSLTVNNFYGGRVVPSKTYGKKSYKMSDYESDWYQTKLETKEAVIYNKSGKKIDRKQKAYINRIDAVFFRNNARDNDQSFDWRYVKKPDGDERGESFEEDFFERVVNVKWKKKKDPKPPKDAPDYFTIVVQGVTYCGWRIDWTSVPQKVITAIVAGGIKNETVAYQFKQATGWGFASDGSQQTSAMGFTEFANEYGHSHPYPPIGAQIFSSVTGGMDSIEVSITCPEGSGGAASFKLGTITAMKNGVPVRIYKSIGPSKIYYFPPEAQNMFTWFITFEGHWVGPGDPFTIADPVKPPMGVTVGGP